jgi:4-carboxymuconolactone decarboxylase
MSDAAELRRGRLSSARVAPRDPASWDAETHEILDGLLAAPGGKVLNIFKTLSHHPKLLKRWLVFGNHVLSKSSLPARERELVILRIGWLCRAEYEWGQHVVIGRKSGLEDDEITRITRGPDAEGWSARDRALLVATDELHGDACISDATWALLSKDWDTQQLMDLVFTVGQYNLVSMALNTLGVQLDDGIDGFPE